MTGDSEMQEKDGVPANGHGTQPVSSPNSTSGNSNGNGNGTGSPAAPLGKHARSAPKADDSPPAKRWLLARAEAALPPWLVKALHSRRHWKNFFRSLVALAAMTVLMVAQKSLDRLGPAAFFGLILGCMLTPSMPLSIFLFAMLTVGIGMLLGWAWGVAGWAAGLDLRSQARFQRQLQEQQALWDPNLPLDINLQKSIFAGAFLDPRSSAIIGVFLFIGAYTLAWLRAKRPKLILLSVYGTIILDMMATFAPLFPKQNYILAKTLLTPAATFMACGLVCTVIFFPESLNHLVLNALIEGGLGPINGLLKLQDTVLATSPTNHPEWTGLATRAEALRKGFAAASSSLVALSKMLQLEISRGRISAGQLSELINKTQSLGHRALSLGSFVIMVEERYQSFQEYQAKPLPHHTSGAKKEAIESFESEYTSGQSLERLMPELASSTAELRKAAEDALGGIMAWLNMVNKTRWSKTPADFPSTASRDAARERLATVLDEFRSTKHFVLLRRFEHLFDPATGEIRPIVEKHLFAGVRSLFRCFVFTSSLISFCVELLEYLELVRVIELSTPRSKLQFPGKWVQTVVANANDSEVGDNDYTVGGVNINEPLEDNEEVEDRELADDDIDEKRSKKTRRRHQWRRDPDARDPTNIIQKTARLFEAAICGLTGPNGIYALRYGVVSIALWVPAVCHSSAKFYYENRGLWALIMAQTGLGIMAGEQLSNMLWRILGTGIGVVAGMVIWYIGAQKGSGNPYGIAIATIAFTAPFLFVRIASPLQQMGFWIVTTVTVVFVVGYSWVDMNYPSLTNPGSGAALAGKRALLVVIGFTAGFIVVLLPRPVSAKKLVREGFSKNIVELGALYGLQNAAFELSRNEANRPELELKRTRYRDRLLKIFGRLNVIENRMGFAKAEPGLKGRWPKENYESLLQVQTGMLASFATLSATYSQLNQQWIHVLTDRVDILHPTFTADCFSLFAILRHSLRAGLPLPPTIPIFERLMHYRRGRHLHHNSRPPSRYNLGNASAVSIGRDSGRDHDSLRPDTLAPGAATEQQPTGDSRDSLDTDQLMLNTDRALWEMFSGVLNWKTCHDEQFALFATVLIAHMHILTGLNQMHRIILDLVGERELDGFDLAQQRWETMQRV